VKYLRSFLGLAGYYRKFVHHFGIIAKPLTRLLKKNVQFFWIDLHQQAFLTLKQALIAAPVLALLDFSKQFQLKTDASDLGVGAVLMQEGHPLAFIRKTLGPRTIGLSTYEKEYLAILIVVEHWRAYLQLAELIIFTDQKSLIHLSNQRLHTHWQHKVFSKLIGLQYKIMHKKATENHVANALSRHPCPTDHLMAISAIQPI
jgi:hypothetical protein